MLAAAGAAALALVAGMLAAFVACPSSHARGSAPGSAPGSSSATPPTPPGFWAPFDLTGSAQPSASPPAGSDPAEPPCGQGEPWSCAWLARFDAAQTFAESQPGAEGIVVHDRQTGASWSNANADALFWTASTIKLAMAAVLLQREAAGAIQLSDGDQVLIDRMLIDSDDPAADQLWFAYSGDDGWSFHDAFIDMGMTVLEPQPYEFAYPYWGYYMDTPRDLVALMDYVLTSLDPSAQDRIVALMRSVGPVQQWGLWAVGPAGAPGVKDGWTDDLDDLSTVGFVGPEGRYTVAIMDDLNGALDFEAGKDSVNQIATLLFDGAF